MAEYGEWSRKGATLSDITAKKEYKVDRDFIIKEFMILGQGSCPKDENQYA